MAKVNMLLLSMVLFIATTKNRVATKSPLLLKTTVWNEKEGGLFGYFVYGLYVSDKGSILAFAEARIANGNDDGAHHIVMKRSTDQGATFSKSLIIVESKNGESWVNPTVVQDQQTKDIFLFYALNHENQQTDVFYKTSKDDGLNWSAAKTITSLFLPNKNEWTFHLPGPGHGIQLKSNRLIIPIWHRKSISFAAAKRNYGVNCIYSDDHGKSWKVGGDTPIGELNESQLIAKQNGELLLIGRTINQQSGAYQAKVWSRDSGKSWSDKLQYDLALTGKACDIGLTSYGAKTYLVSQPMDQTQRKDLTIRMSTNEGETWPIARLLEAGGATYSDLAVLPDKSIICLYGHGGTKHIPQQVSLARFNLDWLLENSK